MDSWIFVESYNNWKEDFKNDFKLLGIDQKKHQLKRPKKNDQIFIYISKIKKFSDKRQILSDDLLDTPKTFNYDKIFSKCVSTKLIKILSEENWIKLEDVTNKMEIFSANISPGLKLLNAPIKLNSFDTNILQEMFNN